MENSGRKGYRDEWKDEKDRAEMRYIRRKGTREKLRGGGMSER